jgi:hypothetical protein
MVARQHGGAGVGGSVFDGLQERLGRKMQQLTQGDRKMPVVTMGWNAERFQGRNLALGWWRSAIPTFTGIAAAAKPGRSPACPTLSYRCRIGDVRRPVHSPPASAALVWSS